MKQLSKIGVNLNQIAYKANSTNDIDKDFYKNEAEEWHEFARKVKSKYL
jgi:di/tripeptidase